MGHSVKARCLGGRLDYFLSKFSWTVWCSETLRFGPPGNTVLYFRHYYGFFLGRSRFYNNYERKILKFGCG
jgi:hypothetical protein